MQNSLYKLFEHKCVLEVCVHIHPIMIIIQCFLKNGIHILKSPFSNQAVLRFLFARTAPTVVDWQDRLTLDPPWVSWEPSAIVSTLVQGKTRCLRLSDWGVLLLDIIMNIAVVINSWHLSCWRCRGLTLLSFWRECADPDLPKCVCLRKIIRDPASSTEEVSIRVFFYESLQITFPNNVLVSQFLGWSLQSARHSTEEREGVSRAH